MHEHMKQFSEMATNYSVTGTGPNRCRSSSKVARYSSSEYMSTAISEGFGNFYAAAMLNDPQGSCAFWVGNASWDCEGNASLPYEFRKNSCGGTVVQGVQWDWTRQFWDVFQSAGMTSTLAMLSRAESSNFTLSNGYLKFDEAAQASSSTRSTWNRKKEQNGIAFYEDGVQSGNYRCAESCGTCGGPGCGSRPGGSANCGARRIRDSGIVCDDGTSPPCNLP